MNQSKKNIDNRFGKHPVITIVFTIIIFILMLDIVAANIYRVVNGYSWNDSLWIHSPIEKSYRVRSNVYHHDLAKNKYIPKSKYRNLTYKVFTNSLGFKDKMVRDIALVSDKYRMLFIGDSFTEGIGFDYEDTFVGRIDKELSKKRIEVFNAAVASYAPSIYWRKIKYLIEDVGFKFNEVVVFLDVSDISDEIFSYCKDDDENIVMKDTSEYLEMARNFNTSGDSNNTVRRISNNIKLMLIDNSIFIYPISSKLRMRFNAYEHKGFALEYYWTVNRDAMRLYGDKGLNKASRYMDKLHDLLNKHGIKLTLCVYPWPQQIAYGDSDSIQESFWRAWCKTNDVGFLDYFPYCFAEKTRKGRDLFIDTYYLEGDCHWNKKGHKLVADIFLENFKNRSK